MRFDKKFIGKSSILALDSKQYLRLGIGSVSLAKKSHSTAFLFSKEVEALFFQE